jgi:hypothetical protein
MSGHGSSAPTPREVPEHFAAYLLQLTAASVLLLVKCDAALPR